MTMKITPEEIQAAFDQQQKEICAILQWKEEVYANHMYNTGLQYLNEYIGTDEEAINQITPRKEFWNWWKNLYNVRNESFIDIWKDSSIALETLRRFYLDNHNPAVLACEMHPPRICYPVSFTHVRKEGTCVE